MTEQLDAAHQCIELVHRQVFETYTRFDSSVTVIQKQDHYSDSGSTKPWVLTDGKSIEKAAVLFTSSQGESLPVAASARNPHLAGRPFHAISISTIIHPWNPHIPTAHMNLRYFEVEAQPPHWHFGGGFDLTPYIPYANDYAEWHQHAKEACGDAKIYSQLKHACDAYFFLPHRQEHRGVGGLFFDDWSQDGFEASLALVSALGQAYTTAYAQIFERRRDQDWSEEEEAWMLYRRGRYAEFNLLYDRGTKYGIQSGRRVESVLASLPPRVKWFYDYQPPSSHIHDIELELQRCLAPQDWV